VIRPIRFFGALTIGGLGAACLAFAGWSVARAFLAMTACLALAFSVNRRPASQSRRPGLWRGGWIVAAAVMLAAMPTDVPGGSGAWAWGFAIGEAELALVATAVLLLLWAIVRLARGVRADPGDRLLIGALAGIVAFVVLLVTTWPPPPVGWLYPFFILLGAALARANGNLNTTESTDRISTTVSTGLRAGPRDPP
jgi:hypothetical protein